jgi:Na+/glutamate symporter
LPAHAETFFLSFSLSLFLSLSLSLSELPWSLELVSFLLLVCSLLAWHFFCFNFLAKRLCPNHWQIRAIAEGGQGMGLTWTGLLFVKIMDPLMKTPVTMAYAAKQLLHNLIMSGGVWSTHVLSIADELGVWPTFGVSFLFPKKGKKLSPFEPSREKYIA